MGRLERDRAYRITARRGGTELTVIGIFDHEYRAYDPPILVFRHTEAPMPAFGFPQGFLVRSDEVVSIVPLSNGE
ncbi:MAG TPA: hypothetical protein VFZ80_06005 [Acidimicrobiia bacterium]